MLSIIRNGIITFAGVLIMERISPSKWRIIGNISFQPNSGDITLIIHLKEGGGGAFLTLTEDELYVMSHMEKDTQAERTFVSVLEDDLISVKMTFTVISYPTLDSDAGGALSCSEPYFTETENIDGLSQTISHDSIIGHPPITDISPGISSDLGNLYSLHFKHDGDLQNVDHAIYYFKQAVESTPSDHADLPSLLSSLGNSYSSRFEQTGNLQDINYAITHHQHAVQSSSFGNIYHPGWLNDLGNSYLLRFKHIGDLQDVDHAIYYYKQAMESTPSDDADLPTLLSNLGNSYATRFGHTGNLQDINQAISHHQRAIEISPSGHDNLSTWLNNIGNSYLRRFEHAGDLQDLDHALAYHQSAVETVESTPSGHAARAHLPMFLTNLGNSYSNCFGHSGSLQDIDHAISHQQSAVESTPFVNARRPGRLNNLGNSYYLRFIHTGHLQDSDHSISYHQKAVEATPPGHSYLPTWLSNLGTSYFQRFQHTGDLHDIDIAISHHQRAVDSTPLTHVNLPSWFNNLGGAYFFRFEHRGDIQDLSHAISYYQRAVEFTPSNHSAFPSRLNNLGSSYLRLFDTTHLLSDIQKSINSNRKGAQGNGAPSIRLGAARKAAMLSAVHDNSNCLKDFEFAISLLSEVAGLEQTIHLRYTNLRAHSNFVEVAVGIALLQNRADLALEWLEQGRCLVWNQFNQLRIPIDNLRVRSSSLADRFIKIARALESHGTRSSSITSNSTLTEDIHIQDETRNHTMLAGDYKQLLKEIRGLPEFQGFLQPPNTNNLFSSLPCTGPIVIFNLHKIQCDALALIAGIDEPLHISLKEFDRVEAQKLHATLQLELLTQREVKNGDRAGRRASASSPSMRFVLKELWCKVVQPVLEALGYSSASCPNPSDRGRIWWCPTGPLSFLPLHAAGIYSSPYQAGQCVSDFVVSSYTPTVNSLNQKFKASSMTSKCTSLVLISQPNTPGLLPIPSTRKETHDIKGLMDNSGIDILLVEDHKATIDKVKTSMKAHNWVHFACHGIQDMSDPLKSGVHLHDGRLELLEIIRQKIPNPDLAFLSACQMSKGDLGLSEEVVHLAAGMLAVGYNGVVGTMWSISDMHAPEFATEFYKYLLRAKGSEGLDSTQAAYALDHAVRKVRERLGDDDMAFLTWVPYVHFGY
ncbi:hypothetical protein M413DRAFT_412983 [Hebeloma cylindrosporum]|uniref:CHAT domain-containing protein n=1 Tax=Hebeloma cylindrosporum TaxID=76867 RepID=A0A0C3CB16_HEBCY|nr:hypothetical protein M413DRAFT_412983 [Hebeloma cylindrosporum h7]